VTPASDYWIDGFSRVWQEDADAEEERAVCAWYRDLLIPYLPSQVACTLDVGCGLGRATSVVAQLCPAACHVAIDGSEEAVTRTAARLRAERIRGHARRVDVTTAGFSQALLGDYGPFDLIVSFFVLHHYPFKTLVDVLRELRALCTNGGAIVLAECHDPSDRRAAATERTCCALADLAGRPHDLLLTPDHLERACIHAGFAAGQIRFDMRPGYPFTDHERATHATTVTHLRARVARLVARAGAGRSPELRALERLVETMAAEGICGPMRHPPAIAVLRPGS
jgi:SAM-dependent methyltransferase